jgi:hypothetical protein
MRRMLNTTQPVSQSTPSDHRDPRGHDPASELYVRSCDLLASARALRDAASVRGSVASIPATLGRLEASLSAMADTAHLLRPQAAERLASRALASARPSRFVAGHEDAEFVALADTLTRAGDQCWNTRQRVGPLLAALSAI